MFFDLHIHSKFSYDSSLSPEKILRFAKKKGLDGVAIVDHNTIRGGVEAVKLANNDFLVVIGAEIKSCEGVEIIGLFLNEEINAKNTANIIDEIKNQDGIVVLPHPFRRNNPTIKKIDEKNFKRLDALEGFNASNTFDENVNAQNLAYEKNLAVIGGSDAHILFEIGMGLTTTDKYISSEDELKRMIISKRTKVLGKSIPLTLKVLKNFERETLIKKQPGRLLSIGREFITKNLGYDK